MDDSTDWTVLQASHIREALDGCRGVCSPASYIGCLVSAQISMLLVLTAVRRQIGTE